MSLHLYNRRTILKAGATSLALPFMESLGMAQVASVAKAASAAAPKRFLFIGCGYGFTKHSFFPTKAGKFSEIGLTDGLKPLDRHKDDITMVSNLTNLGARNPHAGSTTYLTGANVGGTRGRKFINTVSLDQVIAQKVGRDTRFSSLALCGEDAGGHGPGLSMSWSQKGHPIPGIKNPLALYHELFGQSKESSAEREYRLSQKRSILDAVVAELKFSKKKISKTDQDKLEDYLQSIRQIEQSISKEVEWANTPKPDAPLAKPGDSMDGVRSLKILQQLMVAAFQTDSTRVITYRQPVDSLLKSWGMNIGSHPLSHQNMSKARAEISRLKDFKSMELFAGLIDLFKKTPDTNGQSLFDSTLISYGSNIRMGHGLRGCPSIYAGGAAEKLKKGEHIILPEQDTPLANYWITLCQQSGVEMDNFSHSTGTINELVRS